MNLVGRIIEEGLSLFGCFHKYPDVFLIADLYKKNDFFTEYFCFVCGKSILKPMSESKRAEYPFCNKLKREGRVQYHSLSELKRIRGEIIQKYYPQIKL